MLKTKNTTEEIGSKLFDVNNLIEDGPRLNKREKNPIFLSSAHIHQLEFIF